MDGGAIAQRGRSLIATIDCIGPFVDKRVDGR